VTPCRGLAAVARSDTRQNAIVRQRRGPPQQARSAAATRERFKTCVLLVRRRWISWTQHIVFATVPRTHALKFDLISAH
jgi:hypothetical protein